MCANKYVYLDNNGTTIMPKTVIDTMVKWMNKGNPSAEYASAKEARLMMEAFRKEIADDCGFSPKSFFIIFTSGASESNCFIITSTVRSFASKTGRMPHVIISAVEHKSLMSCCVRLEKEKMCQLTILDVGQSGAGLGAVSPKDLEAAIRPNTCIVSIMAANNETGILNNIKDLSSIARSHRVPFHTDAVQLFGKSAFKPTALGVDAFSVSFHKLHGPPGVGLLVIKKEFVAGYDLCSHICGTQNEGLRGGTENLPGIAGSFTAFRLSVSDRWSKLSEMFKLRNMIRKMISDSVPCFYIDDHPKDKPTESLHKSHNANSSEVTNHSAIKAIRESDKKGTPVIFWCSPSDDSKVLPNTLLLAVRRPGFCNRAARNALEKRNVIVSIGSACNTLTDVNVGSAVVYAMGIPKILHSSILRISLSRYTTTADAEIFVKQFLNVITSTECLSTAYTKEHGL